MKTVDNRLKAIAMAFAIAFAMAIPAMAQKPAENKAIKAGETLVYDLYFNWKFVWVKCGRATMTNVNTIYKGEPALKTHLITRGSPDADRFFVMRDTLLAYMTPQMVPLYFRKGAEEGSRYTVNEASFSYANGVTTAKQAYQNKDGEWEYKTNTTKDEVYCMLSMLNRARSFDANKLKPGQRIDFLMTDHNRICQETLIYRRKEVIKAENDVKYRCIVMSFVERRDGKEKEIITFYITDDDNHMPVRLDMNLKFGSAKAFLSSGRNYKYPMTSIVK
ncbi:MAG: DUF3108 domain-containing protein [Bacteroidaceae bacterium]|nr:DUF3108 domain-containing protein [Candidatus Minthousia equi]MCQ2246946.1 DUF3108 domain-containing protein [Bacteroidaceae bacterium]MDO4957502.1 DUF3108 domain-containing protein [Bacteroidales bacterium]